MTEALGPWGAVLVMVFFFAAVILAFCLVIVEVRRSQALRDSKYLRRADQFPSGLIEEGEDQWADGIRYPKPANLNEERE